MSWTDLRILARRLRWMFPALVLIISFGFTGALFGQQPEDRLYVVSHVDVFPPHAAECVKLLEQFETESRQDPGAVRFEVLQESEHPNHFTIVEVWQTRQAFEAHNASEHTKLFRNKLFPWLGSPYDERFNRLPR
jgi:quinol monooxygenase YgiN